MSIIIEKNRDETGNLAKEAYFSILLFRVNNSFVVSKLLTAQPLLTRELTLMDF